MRRTLIWSSLILAAGALAGAAQAGDHGWERGGDRHGDRGGNHGWQERRHDDDGRGRYADRGWEGNRHWDRDRGDDRRWHGDWDRRDSWGGGQWRRYDDDDRYPRWRHCEPRYSWRSEPRPWWWDDERYVYVPADDDSGIDLVISLPLRF
jgi:hypothetical protein